MLVIFSGLPGTGKTTLCHALAAYAPSAVLNKDVIRNAVFGAAHTDYSRQQDDLCGSMMLAAAEYLLRQNRSLHVYLDGRTFSRILHCACSDEVARRRLKDARNHPARNRTFELYQHIQANFEPIAFEHLTLNTDLPLKDSLARAAAYLGLSAPTRAARAGNPASPPSRETATSE
jgi:predicted kinase